MYGLTDTDIAANVSEAEISAEARKEFASIGTQVLEYLEAKARAERSNDETVLREARLQFESLVVNLTPDRQMTHAVTGAFLALDHHAAPEVQSQVAARVAEFEFFAASCTGSSEIRAPSPEDAARAMLRRDVGDAAERWSLVALESGAPDGAACIAVAAQAGL